MIGRAWAWLKSRPWLVAIGAVALLALDLLVRRRKVVMAPRVELDRSKVARAEGKAEAYEEQARSKRAEAERIVEQIRQIDEAIDAQEQTELEAVHDPKERARILTGRGL